MRMLSRFMTPREQAVLLAAAGAIAVGAGVLYFRGASEPPPPDWAVPASPSEIAVDAPPAAPPIEAVPVEPPPVLADSTPDIVVSVAGAVERPGQYRMQPDDRVGDLLDQAVTLEESNIEPLNLSARLIDATTLVVPFAATREERDGVLRIRGDDLSWTQNPASYLRGSHAQVASVPQPAAQPAPAPMPSEAPTSAKMDLNTATQPQLETLPGIGPEMARRIITFREQTRFTRIEELMDVPGIAEKRFEAMRPFVEVR